MKFWHKIILLLAGFILVLTMGILLGTWLILEGSSLKLAENSTTILSEQTKGFVRRLLEERAAGLDIQLEQALSNAVLGAHFMSPDPKDEEIDRLLGRLFEKSQNCSAVYYISDQGDIRIYPGFSLESIERQHIRTSLEKSIPSFDEPPTRLGTALWSRVHVNPFSRAYDLVVDAVAPITASGSVKGFVGVSISLTKIITRFNQDQPLRGSYFFIIDSDFRLLGAPPHGRVELVPTTVKPSRGMVDIRETGNQALDLALRKIVLGESALVEINLGGAPKYLAYHPLRKIQWRTGLVAPVNLVTAASGRLTKLVNTGTRKVLLGILFWAGGLLLLAFLIGILVTRRLTRPLFDFAAVAKKISRGEYDDRVEVSSRDELGIFAQAFNSMAEKIKTTISDLNQANRQLNLKNLELEKEIAEKTTMGEALSKSEEKYRELVENANSIILRLDKKGNILFINEFAQNFFGWQEKEILGRNIMETIITPTESTGRDPELILPEFFRTPESHASGEMENTLRGGERAWVAWTRKSIRNNEEILCIGNDITLRKNLENQLRQAQKMEAIGTLAGGIAHDFNNILGAIISWTELSKTLASSEPTLLKYLEHIHRASLRAAELVYHILSFARQVDRERSLLNVNALVEEALNLLRAALPSTIEIKDEITESPLNLLTDATQIHQIVVNLCTNAAYAMKERGGVLTVRLDKTRVGPEDVKYLSELKPGAYAKLSINDTGSGIPPELLEKIFDPYFTTKKVGEGTGLGLSTVHGIVKSHGGAIRVYSEVGQGTNVNVFLGLNGSEAACESAPSAIPEKGAGRILFVDDEESIAEAGLEILTALGYQVDIKTNSLEALNLFLSRPWSYDLIITDQTMPNLTGLDLAAEIKKLRSDIPIIICTGFSDRFLEEKSRVNGVRSLLRKPFSIAQIAKAVHQALAEKETCRP